MNVNGLDELDIKILDIIKYDARASYEEIAKQVGVSRTAVKNRMKIMEENKPEIMLWINPVMPV